MMNHWLKRCTCACRSYHRRYVAETTLELFAVSATILSPQRCRLLRKDRLVGGEGGYVKDVVTYMIMDNLEVKRCVYHIMHILGSM
ncbi:hypothetical protein Pyn_00702 [Prunus yedoensis var. nudiflora]|uniref:Uncharacterized protein n=1 Tax=Prunus yedoensis var. nudiflora TaxID=2094558 RepID=A0A314UNV4_PRUYE|nr:hypothetical protein Pyn_00702 [Prunus yedoensis var. nudiflora]